MSEGKSQTLTLGVVGTLGQYFVSLSKVCAILCALQAKFSSGGRATGVAMPKPTFSCWENLPSWKPRKLRVAVCGAPV